MNRGQGLEFLNFENLPSFKGRGIILKYLCFIYCCVYRRRCFGNGLQESKMFR